MYLLPPDEKQRKHLMELFNENPSVTPQYLKRLKQWLRMQPHLPDTWDDDSLVNFLRASKFSLEKCKKMVDMYFTVKTAYPAFFTNRDMKNPELQKLLDIGSGALLPKLTKNGSRISFLKTKQDFETPNMADFFKLVFMSGDLRVKFEKGVTDVIIIDVGFPLAKHFFKVNPLVIRDFFICVHQAYPVIVKEVHLINAPAFIYFVINFLKPFLGETLRQCIYVHRGVETLYEFVPRELLPEEYGGSCGKLEDLKMQTVKLLEEYTLWFKEIDQFKADESKRPKKEVVCKEITENEFTHLEID